MTDRSMPQCVSLALLCLLAFTVLMTAGCSSKPSKARYASASTVGSNCYAKALPTAGEGGLAWGSTMGIARLKSLNNCKRYAGRSGGTPNTCRVVLAECK